MNNNGRCPQCHYHQPERTMIIVVRTSCPNCHYIEQGRRSPVFADLTELITWLAAQSGVPISSAEFPQTCPELVEGPVEGPPLLCTSAPLLPCPLAPPLPCSSAPLLSCATSSSDRASSV